MHRVAGVRDCIFCVATAGNQCTHQFADPELGHVGANGNHLTCHLQPWNVRSAGGRIIQPFALENVWTVHGSRVDADQNLIGGRHRHRSRSRHQDFRSAGLFDLNGRHGRRHTIN